MYDLFGLRIRVLLMDIRHVDARLRLCSSRNVDHGSLAIAATNVNHQGISYVFQIILFEYGILRVQAMTQWEQKSHF